MEFTQNFTHDSGRFLCLSGIVQTQAIHSKKHTPLNRLQTITGIRKRSGNNYGHRVVYVRAAHFLVYVDLLDDTGFFLFNIHISVTKKI